MNFLYRIIAPDKTKITVASILFIQFIFVSVSLAQERIISGKVTSSGDRPVYGAAVINKAKGKGVTTDSLGNYSISVANEDTLQISFTGYQSRNIIVSDNFQKDIILDEDSHELNEVVVSALGFTEAADKVAATSSKVEGKSIVRSGEFNFIQGLGGKASGVSVNRSGGDPGSGGFIQIRGFNTISGNTQPLIILDGFPINNTTEGTYTTGSPFPGASGPLQQSRLNDINPNDIASVQILKGASAAGLWGSRAANGVIIISTKKARSRKLNLSFSSTVSIDRVNVYHPTQNKYGQGSNGVYDPTATNSWGDKISERAGGSDQLNTSGAYFVAESGRLYYPIIKKNSRDTYNQSNYDQIFGTGTGVDNSISLSGGNEKSSVYLSAGDFYQQGVFRKNSDYRRTSFRLNLEHQLNANVKVSTFSSLSFIKSHRQRRGNITSGPTTGLLRNPADFDIRDNKGVYYSSPTASPEINRQRSYRNYLGSGINPILSNPLWAITEQLSESVVRRFVNGLELGIRPLTWFDITARLGYDTYTDALLDYAPVNDVPAAGLGQSLLQNTTEGELNTDIIGKFHRSITNNFEATYIAGFNVNDRQYRNSGVLLNNYIIADGPVNPSNSTSGNRIPFGSKRHVRNARFYNTLNVGLLQSIFANISLAGESGSAFGTAARKTFYYPSADIAWQFTQLPVFRNSSILSFGKLRASAGVVGIQPLPYRTQTIYVPATYNSGVIGDQFNGNFYGNGAFVQNSEQGNPGLKPERKSEVELGTDLRLFRNRVQLGFTYYSNEISDLLIPVSLPATTGFVSRYDNAGVITNKGVDIDFSADVVQTKDFQWNVYASINRNRNRVKSLAGTNSLYLTGISGFVEVRAVEGLPVGVFWAGKYARNENGSLALDANNFPRLSPAAGVIGDPNPDWRGNFGTSFSFRKITLDVLFETSQGGAFYEGTRGVMYNFGTHEEVGEEVTLTRAVKNYAGKLIEGGTTVRGKLHDFGGGEVLLDETYYTSIGGGFSDLKEHLITDGSWTRLRQISLSYRLDNDFLKKHTFLESVDISATGRNLLLWTKVKGIDPDTDLTNDPFGRGLDYFNSPNTRSYIFSLRLTY